jgi:lipopolysaccharide/colanic/teichoic acid biosynthesis glycosyltransferase
MRLRRQQAPDEKPGAAQEGLITRTNRKEEALSSQGTGKAPDVHKLPPDPAPVAERVLHEDDFTKMISIERKRTERSDVPFLLMLLETGDQESGPGPNRILNGIFSALLSTLRETDVIGWYNDRTTVGVIFTGLEKSDRASILDSILSRVKALLSTELSPEDCNQITVSCHFYPDDWHPDRKDRACNPALYPDLHNAEKLRRSVLFLKRAVDVAGSALLLLLLAPLFGVIALAVKISSPGPVFFRQERVGQYGRRFTFLKFRSMYVNNDDSSHREYVGKLIAGSAERVPSNGDAAGVFKLAGDMRITAAGKFLRGTSLDEVPQFLNVLMGDMSLVGPRPPIPYELAAYEIWHRRRLLQVKPGITGLWQVMGRSRVPFDEMVRLDLHYASIWTPWLDFKILMRTPGAVIKGAY